MNGWARFGSRLRERKRARRASRSFRDGTLGTLLAVVGSTLVLTVPVDCLPPSTSRLRRTFSSRSQRIRSFFPPPCSKIPSSRAARRSTNSTFQPELATDGGKALLRIVPFGPGGLCPYSDLESKRTLKYLCSNDAALPLRRSGGRARSRPEQLHQGLLRTSSSGSSMVIATVVTNRCGGCSCLRAGG